MNPAPRYPSIRSRYIARAKTLSEDRGFREAIAATLAEWNRRNPRYPHRNDQWAPAEFPRGRYAHLPRAFARVLTESEKHVSVRAWWEIAAPRVWWERDARTLCREWWPPAYYPDWVGPNSTLRKELEWEPAEPDSHPALAFVYGCLLWNPLSVPTEWIGRCEVQIEYLRFDPRAHDGNHMEQYWKERFIALEDILKEHLAAGQTELSAAILNDLECTAEARALKRLHNMFRADAPLPKIPYVRLYPGMNSADWQGLQEVVLRVCARNMHAQARRLAGEGMSKSAIARLLGYDRSQVQQWLASTEPED